jgi:hypothetical protein
MSYGPASWGPRIVLDGSSDNSSVRTSNPVLVADWRQITVSVQTQGTGASRYSIWATNYEGFQTALAEANWSTITAIVAQGIYTIDPGMRFLRATRSAIDSQGTVIFHGRS